MNAGGGFNYQDLRDYLSILGYGRDHSINSIEYWENAAGKHIIFSSNDESLPFPILDDVLQDLGKTMKDFQIFLQAKAAILQQHDIDRASPN